MTLALLLTAVTGAWAEEATITLSCGTTEKTFEKAELPWSSTAAILKEVISDLAMAPGIQTITGGDGKVVKNGNENFQVTGTFSGKATVEVSYVNTSFTTTTTTITVTAPAPEPAIDVKWDPATKTGTFEMPAFDVEIAPIYAPTAMFATDGNLVLTPTAIEGIYAESTDAIVKAGTVAKIGETENPQGIVMYAVTSTNQATAPELSAFSATVPTAKDIADDGATLYVWYYIQGADAPDGVAATLDNTFSDTEPACLTVTVLTNKFDITLKAANANTIDATQASKGTVTVGGTAATVTDGKLQGVKMGSEVKMTAKQGYKFRKVEVKKGGGAKPLANATTEDLGKVVGADGNIYANKDAAEAANTTAVAMICYVVEGHGLALALTDEVDKMNWSTAQTTCDAHTPAITGGKWMLASKGEWDNMISAAGSYSALRDGFSSVGGTNMQSEGYWSSTEDDSSDAWNYYFSNGLWSDVSKNWNRCVRACLAF